MPPETRDTGIRLTINGTEVPAENGHLLIDVAESYGVFVPRFCYHPGMDSVAACRMTGSIRCCGRLHIAHGLAAR